MKENLDIGTMIDSLGNATNNGTIEKYCYRNDPANCTMYGGLYQWSEAMQYSTTPGARGVCPQGWHIPTEAEFHALSLAVGSDGNALKAVGQGSGEGAGSNGSGFTALLAGHRWYGVLFGDLGDAAYFWGSTAYDATDAVLLSMTGIDSIIDVSTFYPGNGCSVRCVKD